MTRTDMTRAGRFRQLFLMTALCVAPFVLMSQSVEAGPRIRGQHANDTTFSNGLTVLAYEDKSDPLIAITVLYDVGSRDDPVGRTGLAKVCEWIMNNGSLGYRKGERERLLHASGGSLSSVVWQDNSMFMSRFPKEALRTVLLMESDRLESPVISRETVESAKRSVLRRRRITRNNDIYSALTTETLRQSFTTHPYRNDVFGSESDLLNIEVEDVRRFMRSYYQPENVILAIVGDFKTKSLFKEIAEIFGDIPNGALPNHTYEPEPKQESERRETVEAPLTIPVFIVSFHTPGLTDSDRLPLEVLATMLVGDRSSILYQDLVTDSGLCFSVGGAVAEFSDPSLLYCYGFLNPDVTFPDAEALLNTRLNTIRTNGLNEADLIIAKNQMEARFYESSEGALGRSMSMARSQQVWGDGSHWESRIERITNISLEDVTRVAQKYLANNNRVSIFLKPQSGVQ